MMQMSTVLCHNPVVSCCDPLPASYSSHYVNNRGMEKMFGRKTAVNFKCRKYTKRLFNHLLFFLNQHHILCCRGLCIFSLRKIGLEIALALCIRNILISYVLELVMLISHMEVIG